MNIENNRILIIDANNLFYRYYYRDSRTCLEELEKIYTVSDYSFEKIIVIFDSENRTRDKFISSYKANRKKSEDIKQKLKEFENSVQETQNNNYHNKYSVPVIFLKINRYEADDLVFYLTQKLQNKKIMLATTDKDYYQFLTPNVKICKNLSVDGCDFVFDKIYELNNFNQEFAYIDPLTQYPILKALVGDPSDNIKGLYKVGDKTALKLLAQAPDIKSMYSLITIKYGEKEAKQFLIDYQLIMPLPIKFMSAKDLSHLKKVIKNIQ